LKILYGNTGMESLRNPLTSILVFTANRKSITLRNKTYFLLKLLKLNWTDYMNVTFILMENWPIGIHLQFSNSENLLVLKCWNPQVRRKHASYIELYCICCSDKLIFIGLLIGIKVLCTWEILPKSSIFLLITLFLQSDFS